MQPKKTTGASARARRPSGFDHTRQPSRPAAAQAAAEKPAPEPAREKPRKEARARRRRVRGERRPVSRRAKILLAAISALLVLYLALALIFGGNRTVHQLPLVVREEDITPAPTATAAISGTGEAAT